MHKNIGHRTSMGHKVACDKTKRGCDEDVEQGNKRLCGGVI